MSVEKFADLTDAVGENIDTSDHGVRTGIEWTLEWLDEHPDRVPGRTMTESEYLSAVDAAKEAAPNDLWWQGRAILSHAEVKIVDPEPTNAEKWKKFCEGLGINLEPWQIDYLSRHMDEAGVTAP